MRVAVRIWGSVPGRERKERDCCDDLTEENLEERMGRMARKTVLVDIVKELRLFMLSTIDRLEN